jgi:hypothetical protein
MGPGKTNQEVRAVGLASRAPEGISSRNVLLVALDPLPEDEVRRAIAERNGGREVKVHVVAPATHVGSFQWLTGADDDARAEAAERADRTAEAIDAEVETEVGERDPLLAVEDALALFPADEILVAGTADAKTEAGLRGLGRRSREWAAAARSAAGRQPARRRSPTTSPRAGPRRRRSWSSAWSPRFSSS